MQKMVLNYPPPLLNSRDTLVHLTDHRGTVWAVPAVDLVLKSGHMVTGQVSRAQGQ